MYWHYRSRANDTILATSIDDAFKLYGVESKLQSIRLYHQDADHGLIRVFVWEKPTNDGLQLTIMKVIGNRWGAMMTNDICNVQNHVEEAINQKMPIYYVPLLRVNYFLNVLDIVYLSMVKSMNCHFFEASQITNVGLLIYDDAESLNFYDQVLGLLRLIHRKCADMK